MKFLIIATCLNNINTNKLVYVMYLLGVVYPNTVNLKFRVNSYGFTSKQLNDYITDLINDGVLEQKKGIITVTTKGIDYYDNTYLTYRDSITLSGVLDYALGLTETELHFMCLIDRLTQEYIKKYGTISLLDNRDKITVPLSTLSKEYSFEKFNLYLHYINSLRRKK